MGEKCGFTVYRMEKGILQIPAVSASVSSSVKWAHNRSHELRAIVRVQ